MKIAWLYWSSLPDCSPWETVTYPSYSFGNYLCFLPRMLSLPTFSLTVWIRVSFIPFTVCFIALAILKAGIWFIDEINEQITWWWTDPGCRSALYLMLVQKEHTYLGCSRYPVLQMIGLFTSVILSGCFCLSMTFLLHIQDVGHGR